MNKKTSNSLVNAMLATECDLYNPSNVLLGELYRVEANASLFSDAHFSQPLTQYSVGWAGANPMVEQTLEFVAPAVQVPRKFSYRKAVNAEFYISETDDIRAEGADFGIVKYTTSIVNDKTYNKGLTIVEDKDEVADEPGWEQERVNRLMKRLKLNDLRRAVTLLLAAATDSAQTWSTSFDPDNLLAARITLGNQSLGSLGLNRILYGVTAWSKRNISLSGVATAGGFTRSVFTPAQLAAFLGVQEILVDNTVYISTGTTKATVVDTTWGTTGIAVAFNAQSGMSKDDPSNIKRFWTPCENGTEYRVYREEHCKTVSITVEHYSKISIVSTAGLQKVTVS